ncbi:MAG TPA: O-antigen ligase family protein [Caulobacteraceae bacterium]|nr:O-antigen ligase family protein [Caulobacteraceae bacterium]
MGAHAGGGFAFGAAAFLVVALVCGGASASPTSAMIVRLAAIPVLALGLWRLSATGAPPKAWFLLGILIATAALILVQLIPLPPPAWRALPGHAIVASVYAAASITPPWLPISLDPAATWDAFLGLIPPAAMFIAARTLGSDSRRMLVWTVLALALVSVGLGMLQMAGGPGSRLRFYAITNPESADGFFANRNHQGAFLALSLPLAAWLAARRWRRGAPPPVFRWVALAGFGLVVMVGAATTGSRAALGLIIVGGVGAALVAMVTRAGGGRGALRLSALYMPAVLALAACGLLALTLDAGLEKAVTARMGPEARLELTPRVAAQGAAFAPFGAGAGSFIPVYRALEPETALHKAFTNHAHDDYVEVWLEAGLPGLALIAAFLVWWVMTSWRAVARSQGAGLGLAGSVMIGMLLVHSLVDYPLRTSALGVIAALACALMLAGRDNIANPSAA